MTDHNTGSKRDHSTALTSGQMTYENNEDAYLLQVAGHGNPGPTPNLRGVEPNTNYDKGFPNTVPAPSAEPHTEGASPTIEEST